MKKIAIICSLAVSLVFASCDDSKNKQKEQKETEPQKTEVTTNDENCEPQEDNLINDEHLNKYREYYVLPGEFNVEETNELVAYFNYLEEIGFVIASRSEGPAPIKSAIVELEKYAKGKRKYYPEEDVNNAIDLMSDTEGYAHGNEEYISVINKSSVFLYRFMEQAARLCPNIEFLADFCSEDKQIGIINHNVWNTEPLLSMVIYKTKKGCKIQMIGKPEEVAIEKVFCLSDKYGNKYYLCSNNNSFSSYAYNHLFAQFLYQKTGDGIELVCHTQDMPEVDAYKSKIIFNPKRRCWEHCEWDGKYYQRIKGSPRLNLIIDGKNSYFEVEEITN